ncbi:MAG: HEAT repeat domain-containing protein [Planctomycetota bacterium]
MRRMDRQGGFRAAVGAVVIVSLGGCSKEAPRQVASLEAPESVEVVQDPALPEAAYRDTTDDLQGLVDAGPAPLSDEQREALLDLIRTAFDGTAGARLASRAERSLGDEEGIELALEWAITNAESPLVRANAARALAERRCYAVLPLLVHRTKYEKDWAVYVALCEALAVLGNDSGAALLDALIPIPQAQGAAGAAALRLLATVGLPQAEGVSWEQLRAALGRVSEQWLATGRPFVAPAVEGAEAPGPRETAPTDDAFLNARLAQRILDMTASNLRPTDDARLVLRSLGTVGLETLRIGLVDERAQIRTACLDVVRDLQTVAQPLVPEVLPQLDDFVTGSIACIALGRTGDPEALPFLAARSRSESLETRQSAVDGLAWLRHPEALLILRERLRDPEEIEGVKVQAALGLALYDEGLRYLLELRANEGYHLPTLDESVDLIRTERSRLRAGR